MKGYAFVDDVSLWVLFNKQINQIYKNVGCEFAQIIKIGDKVFFNV